MGLVDGAGEARRVHYTSDDDDDDDEDYAGSGQPDVTFLHSSSIEVVRISQCDPDALLVHPGQVRRLSECVTGSASRFKSSVPAAMICFPLPPLYHRAASRTPGAA